MGGGGPDTHQPRPAQEEQRFLGSQSLKKDTKVSWALGLQVLLVTFLLLFRTGPLGPGIAPQFSPLDRSREPARSENKH